MSGPEGSESGPLLDWSKGSLAEGLECYSTHRFFEAHEHWETVWLTLPQPEKRFLQALIQITVGFHHLHRENRLGAARQLTASLRKLEEYPGEFRGIAVGELREALRAAIEAVEAGEALAHIHPPQIR